MYYIYYIYRVITVVSHTITVLNTVYSLQNYLLSCYLQSDIFNSRFKNLKHKNREKIRPGLIFFYQKLIFKGLKQYGI